MLEVLAVLITGIGKYVFVDILALKFWYITIAAICWLLYILIRLFRNRALRAYWGFQKRNFKKLFFLLFPVVLFCVGGFIVYGFYRETLTFNWHIFPVLLLYPIWGTLQQFLMVSLVASNLRDYQKITVSPLAIIIITSILFSLVHLPSLPLVGATLFLGIVYTALFLRYQNVWVLGIYHGWLGGCFYFFVLDRDPWQEIMSTL
jgi:hypothetical protein